MTARLQGFRASYAAAFGDYRRNAAERTLRVAYELGRSAVARDLSVLDLAIVHHEILLSALRESADLDQIERTTRAAGEFFLETLSAFEMVQRGFWEARETASLERRHALVVRRLSGFLADASLALDASDSLEEILRLVTEQARELIDADCCVASVALGGEPRIVEAVSYPEADGGWREILHSTDLPAVYRLITSTGGATRLSGQDVAELLPFRAVSSKFRALVAGERRDRFMRGWLGAPLTTLDGRELGSIQLLDKHEGDFTEVDEAVLIHLSQMASAAVERAWLYERDC